MAKLLLIGLPFSLSAFSIHIYFRRCAPWPKWYDLIGAWLIAGFVTTLVGIPLAVFFPQFSGAAFPSSADSLRRIKGVLKALEYSVYFSIFAWICFVVYRRVRARKK
jgi:hypothetical protein